MLQNDSINFPKLFIKASFVVIIIILGIAAICMIVPLFERAPISPEQIVNNDKLTFDDKVKGLCALHFKDQESLTISGRSVFMKILLSSSPTVNTLKNADSKVTGQFDSAGAYMNIGFKIKASIRYFKTIGVREIKIIGSLPISNGDNVEILGVLVNMDDYEKIVDAFAKDGFGASQNAFEKAGIILFDNFDKLQYKPIN